MKNSKLPTTELRSNKILTFNDSWSENIFGFAIRITVIICALCGSEAEVAIDGVPLCEGCSRKAEGETGKPKTDREIRAALQREILTSTARAHAASQELRVIMGDIPSGLPQPDGSQRIQNAAHALAAARNDVMRAHSRLNEFLIRGVVPDDFEPGSPA